MNERSFSIQAAVVAYIWPVTCIYNDLYHAPDLQQASVHYNKQDLCSSRTVPAPEHVRLLLSTQPGSSTVSTASDRHQYIILQSYKKTKVVSGPARKCATSGQMARKGWENANKEELGTGIPGYQGDSGWCNEVECTRGVRITGTLTSTQTGHIYWRRRKVA